MRHLRKISWLCVNAGEINRMVAPSWVSALCNAFVAAADDLPACRDVRYIWRLELLRSASFCQGWGLANSLVRSSLTTCSNKATGSRRPLSNANSPRSSLAAIGFQFLQDVGDGVACLRIGPKGADNGLCGRRRNEHVVGGRALLGQLALQLGYQF